LVVHNLRTQFWPPNRTKFKHSGMIKRIDSTLKSEYYHIELQQTLQAIFPRRQTIRAVFFFHLRIIKTSELAPEVALLAITIFSKIIINNAFEPKKMKSNCFESDLISNQSSHFTHIKIINSNVS